jgi:hypothetical protein
MNHPGADVTSQHHIMKGFSRFPESYLYGAKTMYYATANSFYIRIYSDLMTINLRFT